MKRLLLSLLLACSFTFCFAEQPFADDPFADPQEMIAKTPPHKQIEQSIADAEAVMDAEIASGSSINLKEIFYTSPIIYTLLGIMSTLAVIIWLYTFFTVTKRDFLPKEIIEDLRAHLSLKNYEKAQHFCQNKKRLITNMVSKGLINRKHGPSFMIDTMKSEGMRSTAHLWQRINLLNDIVVIAPMLGLLGTVIGMFYAFYDINRSSDSISTLFDGLGIAVGTT
ncbi:MAG TPA: MotA/TolQ/ExbB proton channel family protein, partial [Chlamydiales bacterium]|nr:MotA/TolQ/ExbB proton channel family protein [Chlamydiales bacterium]